MVKFFSNADEHAGKIRKSQNTKKNMPVWDTYWNSCVNVWQFLDKSASSSFYRMILRWWIMPKSSNLSYSTYVSYIKYRPKASVIIWTILFIYLNSIKPSHIHSEYFIQFTLVQRCRQTADSIASELHLYELANPFVCMLEIGCDWGQHTDDRINRRRIISRS